MTRRSALLRSAQMALILLACVISTSTFASDGGGHDAAPSSGHDAVASSGHDAATSSSQAAGSSDALISESLLAELDSARHAEFEARTLVEDDWSVHADTAYVWFVIAAVVLIVALCIAGLKTRVLGKLSIGPKLYLGFGVTALVIVAISATTVSLMKLIQLESHLAEEFLEMEVMIAKMTTLQNEFLAVGITDVEAGKKILHHHRELAKELHVSIDINHEHLTPTDAAAMKKVQGELSKYEETFAELVVRYHEVEVLKEKLDGENADVDNRLAAMLHAAETRLDTLQSSGASLAAIIEETHLVEALAELELTALRLSREQVEFLLDRHVDRVDHMRGFLAEFRRIEKETELLVRATGTDAKEIAADLQTLRSLSKEMNDVEHNIGLIIVDEYKIEVENFESLAEVEAIELALETLAHRAERLADETEQTGEEAALILLAIGVGTALLMGLTVTRAVTEPLAELHQRINDIASSDGDLTQRIEITSENEFGQLAMSFNGFVEKIHAKVTELASTSSALGNSSKSLSAASTQLASSSTTVATLSEQAGDDVERILDRIGTVAAAVEEASTNIAQTSSATEQISGGFKGVVTNSEEMSTNINSVAAAIEQLSASLETVSSNSAESAVAGRKSAQKAKDAADQIETLVEAASRIGEVIRLIEDIAAQTNLLALNATIEAASAGDAGRGFAVVAGEVKELAAQTASATDDISKEVGAIQKATQGAFERIKEVTEDAGRVDELATVIASAVEEQSSTTREVASNIARSAEVASEVSQSVSEVSRSVDEVCRQTGELSKGTNEIAETSVHVFKDAKLVSAAMQAVRSAVADAATVAEQLASEANQGAKLANDLDRIVGQFRI